MKKIFTLPRLILFLIILLIGLVVFVYIYPVKPLVVKSLTVDSSQYTAGSQLSYTVDRCKYVSNDLPGSVDRYLQSVTHPNQAEIFINETKTSNTPRGCGLVKQTILLQTNIPHDTYKLVIVYTYNQHLWGKLPLKFTTISNNTFEVN